MPTMFRGHQNEATEVKICEVGGEGLFLPLFGDAEQAAAPATERWVGGGTR